MLVLVTPPSPGPRPLGCNSPGRLQAAYIFYRWLLGDQSCVMWTLLSLVLWWKWNVIGPFNLTSTMLILKVNPKRANSGHFKLTIDGLLRAINQTMEVGWGDWRLCWHCWQRLITDIIIITRLSIWMLSQYGSGVASGQCVASGLTSPDCL